MFLLNLILRLVGLAPKGKSLSKKAQILARNKKLHIILAAHRQHQQAQEKTRVQGEAVAKKVSTPDRGSHVSRFAGATSEKSSNADVVIGKSAKASQTSFTSKVRTVKGRKQRRKHRGRMRGFQ